MKVDVIVKFTISNMPEIEECQEIAGCILPMLAVEMTTRELIDEEGLFGIIDDDYKIMEIKPDDSWAE